MKREQDGAGRSLPALAILALVVAAMSLHSRAQGKALRIDTLMRTLAG